MPSKSFRPVKQTPYSHNDVILLKDPIITLINNTVGVAALAMPFCFHQCGILLSFLFLGITAIFSVMSCDALIYICSAHRVLPFEYACFKALGYSGKCLAELSIIGLLFGYVVGYYVTIADLSTGVASLIAESVPPERLRVFLLVIFTLTLIPLCLVSKVQNLLRLNVFTSLFYGVVTFHMIFVLGLPRLISNMPWGQMNWWQPDGLIECIPIFLASMFCQTQLHVTSTNSYQPTPSSMRLVVRVALATVAVAYGFFGFFGYAAFFSSNNSKRITFSGNVFLMYPDDFRSFCIRVGFLLTNIVSIPLIIFPLRQSVYNLFYRKNFTLTSVDVEMDSSLLVSDEIPRRYFQKITIAILLISFLLSLTTDKIEVIIRLTTSVAGSLTGFILPALVLLVATAAASKVGGGGNSSSSDSSTTTPEPLTSSARVKLFSISSSWLTTRLRQFSRFGRNYSAAYCLLFVGCLLFSLEFFTVHHTTNPVGFLEVDSVAIYSNVLKSTGINNATMKSPPQPIDIKNLQSYSSKKSVDNLVSTSTTTTTTTNNNNNDNNNNNNNNNNAIPPPLAQYDLPRKTDKNVENLTKQLLNQITSETNDSISGSDNLSPGEKGNLKHARISLNRRRKTTLEQIASNDNVNYHNGKKLISVNKTV